MKIFQTTQTNLALLGFERNLRPFNKRQRWILIEGFLAVTACYVYLLLVADSSKEFMDSIFTTGVSNLILISHISTVLKTETIFVFIDDVEDVINASEFKHLLGKIHHSFVCLSF